MTYSQAANLAVNQTLVRSINTSIIALLPVAAILFVGVGLLGAGTLKDLALALFIGIAAGAYSSIFIATPLLCQIKEREPAMQALAKRVAARRSGLGAKAGKGTARKRTTGSGTATAPASGGTATALRKASRRRTPRTTGSRASQRPQRRTPGPEGCRAQRPPYPASQAAAQEEAQAVVSPPGGRACRDHNGAREAATRWSSPLRWSSLSRPQRCSRRCHPVVEPAPVVELVETTTVLGRLPPGGRAGRA